MPMRWFSFILVLGITGCAALDPYLNPNPQTSDAAHFEESTIVYDDGKFVTFSTVYGQQNREGSVVWDDNFFRGFIDKTTGQKSFQVYNVIYYSGNGRGDWRRYRQANYTVPTGQQVIATQNLGEREDCSALGLYGKCVYTEHVAFDLTEQLFQQIAQNDSSNVQWMYQLIPQQGDVYPDSLLSAEAAGLLNRMAAYRMERNTSALSVPVNKPHPATTAIQIKIPQAQLPPTRHIPDGQSVF